MCVYLGQIRPHGLAPMNGRDERRGMAMGVAQRRTVIAYGRLAMRELRLAPARECTRFGAPQGMAFIQGGSAAGRWRTDTFNWQQCRTRSICSLILEKPASASQLRQRLRSHQGVELLPGNPQRFSGRHHSSVKKLGPIPPAAIGPAVKPGELSRYHRRGALHLSHPLIFYSVIPKW